MTGQSTQPEMAQIVIPSQSLGSPTDPPAVHLAGTPGVSHTITTPAPAVIQVASSTKGTSGGGDKENNYVSHASVVSAHIVAQKLSWHNVCYAIPVPLARKPFSKQSSKDAPPPEMKSLLSNVSGEILAGEVVAIMGGSGAGKTTLLNTLAGRVGPAGTLTGQVLVDDAPRNPAFWTNLCAYVEQDDILYSNLSVYETIKFAALLRLPKTMSLATKLERVEEVIMELGLNGCRNTWIGGPEMRGISGGERKRVSIAIELVSQPTILFLDEPTSGLDAFTAVNIIDTIKKLAVSQKKIVLMTIHQPRTDILEMFDKIALLSVGRLAFYGPLSDALDYFTKLGFPLPPKTNPSDFFMDVVTLDQRTEDLKQSSLARIKIFHDAWAAKEKALEDKSHSGEKKVGPTDSQQNQSTSSSHVVVEWPSTWMGEFSVLLTRNMLDVLRDFRSSIALMVQSAFLMLLVGFTFFQVGYSQRSIQNRLGAIFFLCVNGAFLLILPLVTAIPIQRVIVRHERASGAYRPSSAFLAKCLSVLPVNIMGMLIVYYLPVYFMIGLQMKVDQFFAYFGIFLVHITTCLSIGILIGSSVPSPMVAQIISTPILLLLLVFGGLYLNLGSVPWALRWIQYISVITYSNKAAAQNEFTGLKFNCSNPDQCIPDGSVVLSMNALDNVPIWACVGANLGMMLFCLAVGYFSWARNTKPLQRYI